MIEITVSPSTLGRKPFTFAFDAEKFLEQTREFGDDDAATRRLQDIVYRWTQAGWREPMSAAQYAYVVALFAKAGYAEDFMPFPS